MPPAGLGVKAEVFPSGHTGWLLRSKGFAPELAELLTDKVNPEVM
jgi:hypothetical protein